MPTNDERAERAREVLEMYAVQFGDPYDPRGTLIDVLTDLMHLAAREPELGLEFDSSLKWLNFTSRLRPKNVWILNEMKPEVATLSSLHLLRFSAIRP